MDYHISIFEKLVEEGFLRKSEKDHMVLYGYTEKCTFEKHWNEFTRVARGLILNKSTGEVIAKPFPKFFNLNEMEETKLANLPTHLSYRAYDKVDGSLGIIFHNGMEWDMATRGSFYSIQAQKGKELMKKYSMNVPFEYTLLVEIVYPENKIIVDYGDKEELVLLGAYDRHGREADHNALEQISKNTNLPLVKSYDLTIEQMIEMQKTMPRSQEGFVIRFDGGLRVKIKGDEYMKVARILSHMSPLSFWDTMDETGTVDVKYLSQLPEEFRDHYEPIVQKLKEQYNTVLGEIQSEFSLLPKIDWNDQEKRKTVALYIQNENLKHKSAMFLLLNGKKEKLTDYIKKQIRPDGNELRNL